MYQNKYNLARPIMFIISAGLKGMDRDKAWIYNGICGTAGAHVEDAGNLHFFNLAVLVRFDLSKEDPLARSVVEKILEFCRYNSKVWIFLPSRCDIANLIGLNTRTRII